MRWVMLALLFLTRSTLALTFQGLGAVAPLAAPSLGVDHAAMGELISLYWLPGAILALPAGVLASRFGPRRLALASLVLLALGSVLLARSDSYAMAALARLIGGSGNAMLSVLLSAMAVDWFRGRELSMAMAILMDSWPFGLAVATASLPAVAALASWRMAITLTAILSLAAALLLGMTYRSPGGEHGAALRRHPPSLVHALRRESLMPALAAVLWATYNAGLLVFLTYAPPMLAAGGMALAAAAAAVSLATWGAMVSMPPGGWVADRRGALGATIILACLGAAAAGIALCLGVDPVLSCLIFGLLVGLPAGGLISLPARFSAPEYVGWALGWFMTIYYALLTLAQLLAGYVREGSGSDEVTVLLACGMLAATALGFVPLEAIRRWRRAGMAALP